MRVKSWLCGLAVAAVVAAGAAWGQTALVKPPDAKSLAATLSTVQDVYGDEIKAAKTAADKVALAEKLIGVGIKETDPDSKFALLTLGRDLATESGSLVMAAKAIDALAAAYSIDGLKMRAAAATAAAAKPRSAEAGEACKVLGDWITSATMAERFDVADEMASQGAAFARAAGDGALQREATARAAAVKDALAVASVAKLALITLTEKPDDPDANLIVGKYFCFVKGDWDKGVPLLAKGPESPLKAAAKKDAAGSTDADTDVAIADKWWELTETASGLAKPAIVARAIKWYNNALPGLTGLQKTKVEKRLKEIEDANAKVVEAQMRDVTAKVSGVADKNADGVLLLTQYGNKIKTNETFKAPVQFKIALQTDGGDFRMSYGCDQIIFNWEGEPTQLRIDGGPVDGSHKKGTGAVAKNKWVTIDLIVAKDRMIIKVDGEERQNVKGDFTKVEMPLTIWPNGSRLGVKSIKVGTAQ